MNILKTYYQSYRYSKNCKSVKNHFIIFMITGLLIFMFYMVVYLTTLNLYFLSLLLAGALWIWGTGFIERGILLMEKDKNVTVTHK